MSTRRDATIGRIFGIGAGLSYGISSVLIRWGVGDMAPPLAGAAIAMITGTLGLFGDVQTWHPNSANEGLFELVISANRDIPVEELIRALNLPDKGNQEITRRGYEYLPQSIK